MLNKELISKYNGLPNEKNIVFYGDLRINILTDRVIRVESSTCAKYVDEASVSFINRNTNDVLFEKLIENNYLYIKTKFSIFKFSKNKFIGVSFDNGKTFIQRPKKVLEGTIRTLDVVGKKVPLSKSIMSRNGLSIIDDSNSLLFNCDGTFKVRDIKQLDLYIFTTIDYLELLKDFYIISGNSPLIPRYCFGNWWSRYYSYSQDGYIELMNEFKKHDIPLSVSVIDMDWHKSFRSSFNDVYKDQRVPFFYKRSIFGWTGYTFDKDLFYDYKKFFNDLHEMNLHITLNLHPAQGIWSHEESYEYFKNKYPLTKYGNVEFDFTNPDFINDYFNILHYPLEKDGVDFWWIDWQQGVKSKMKGLDPLLSLNHYHYLSSLRNNKRGLILSRYNGIGAQRYPIGFSGDSIVNFKVLDFIPYFTSCSTNVGYPLWSHDIGSHMHGYTNNELYTRWIEFGVFSPINRLHSSKNNTFRKEPWMYDENTCRIASFYLRLRNKLIPYLYSTYLKTSIDLVPFISPLYYYDHNELAYKTKNAYMLGEDLYVYPSTSKLDKKLLLSIYNGYVIKGDFIDIFTKKTYIGGKNYLFKTELNEIPVLLKLGSTLPVSYDYNDINEFKVLELITSIGNNSSTLLEDDGISLNSKALKSSFTSCVKDDYFEYNVSSISNRSYVIKPINIDKCDYITLNKNKLYKKIIDNKTVFYNEEEALSILNPKFEIIDSNIIVLLNNIEKSFSLKMYNYSILKESTFKEELDKTFSRLNESNLYKDMIYKSLSKKTNSVSMVNLIKFSLFNKNTKKVLIDLINKFYK